MASILFTRAFDGYKQAHIPSSMPALSQKIRQVRKRMRLNQTDFANLIGVTQPTISRWEDDSSQTTPDFEFLAKISRHAGEDLIKFALDEDDHPYVQSDLNMTVPVVGALQAGAFIEAATWAPEQQFTIQVPTPKNWPGYTAEGFVVKGTSMNRLFPEDSVVFAIPTIANQLEPSNGDKVIVQRKDKEGLVEVTLKEFVIDRAGRRWLWPRSDDPEWQQPLLLVPPQDEDEEAEAVVTGIVIGAYVPMDWGRDFDYEQPPIERK